MCPLLIYFNTWLFFADSLDLSALGDALGDSKQATKKSPHSFLGENSSLVNLDNLVTISPKPAVAPAPQGMLNYRNLLIECDVTVHFSSLLFYPFVCFVFKGTFATVNPFSSGPAIPAPAATASNLFQQQAAAQAARPSINQIRQQPFGSSGAPQPSSGLLLPQPLQPNPFLS